MFHIITSHSALGVKELIVKFHRSLIVPLTASEEKNDLQLPENFTVPFLFSVQKVKLPGSHRAFSFLLYKEGCTKPQVDQSRLFVGLTRRDL